jgi:DNA-binding MarR family transcriptional regulator
MGEVSLSKKSIPPEPLPFSERELQAWRSLLRLYATVMRRVDGELDRAHGLGNTEYGVLVVLVNAPERSLRSGELAARNMASPGGMTRIVDRLAALGLVERRPAPDDRRGAYVRLTDAGVRKLRELQLTHHRVARELFLGRLSERELQRFAELAERALPGVATSPVWAAPASPSRR